MKRISFILLLLPFLGMAQQKISEMPTKTGTVAPGTYVPVAVGGQNFKFDLNAINGKLDSISIGQGPKYDTLFNWKGGVKVSYKLTRGVDSTDIAIDTADLKLVNGSLTVNKNNIKPYWVYPNTAGIRSIGLPNPFTIYNYQSNGITGQFEYSSLYTGTDDSVMFISSPAGGGYRRILNDGKIYAEWFGAKVNDGIDDTYPIWKAAMYSINSATHPTLGFLNSGRMEVTNLRLQKLSGSFEQPFSLTIEGPMMPFDLSYGGWNFTQIIPTLRCCS